MFLSRMSTHQKTDHFISDRKPVDPPPIVQLKVSDPYNDTW